MEAALRMEQCRHHTARVERQRERREPEILPAKWIRDLARSRCVVFSDRLRSSSSIDALRVRNSLDGITLFQAAVGVEFSELFFQHRNLEDPLIEDCESMASLLEHDFREARVAKAFITETAAILADENATFFDRRPGQNRAVRISDGSITLVRPHVVEARTQLLTPDHGFAFGSLGAEVGSSGNLRTVPLNQLPISAETVDGKERCLGTHFGMAAARVDDPALDDAILDNQLTHSIAACEGDVPFVDCLEQVVDKIDSLARGGRVEPRNGMPNVLVNRDELHPSADLVHKPLDGFRGNLSDSLHKLGIVGLASNPHQILEKCFRVVFYSGLSLETAARARHRTGRQSRIATGPLSFFHDGDIQARIRSRYGSGKTAGTCADDQEIDLITHDSCPDLSQSLTRTRSRNRVQGLDQFARQIG